MTSIQSTLPHYEVNNFKETLLIFVSIKQCEVCRTYPEFLDGFSEQELDYSLSKARGSHSLSARYAAKRGAELISELPWYDFEVIRSPEGVPRLSGRTARVRTYLKTTPIILSLAHDDPYALAYLS